MSEDLIVRLSAPTLAGIKTGSLFRVTFDDRRTFLSDMRRLNRSVRRAGITVVPLRSSADSAIVYLYRPSMLERDLRADKARSILDSLGYQSGRTAFMVAQLSRRFSGESFPHEVGLFLGYPASDVTGFINDPRRGYKLNGTWKVYGDAASAEREFRKFRICISIYTKALRRGAHISDLAVRV